MAEARTDLRQTVNDVNSLQDALKNLQSVAQQLFGNLGQLSETFGQTVNRAASNAATSGGVAGAGSAMLTSVGEGALTNLANHIAKQKRVEFETATAGTLTGMGGHGKVTLPTGIRIGSDLQKTFAVDPNEFHEEVFAKTVGYLRGLSPEKQKKYIDRFGSVIGGTPDIQARAQAESSPIDTRMGSSTGEMFGPYAPKLGLGAIGYGLGDIAGSLGQAKKDSIEIGKLTETLNNMDKTNKAFHGILETLSREVKESATAFGEAVSTWESNNTDINKTEMMNRFADYSKAKEQYRAAERGSGGGGGEKDDAGRTTFSKKAEVAGALIGTAIGAATIGLGVASSLNKSVYAGELATAQATGSLERSKFEIALGSSDMTNPENLLRYRANLLMPYKKFNYIGTEGIDKSIGSAGEMASLKISSEKIDRANGIVSGIGGIAQGLLSGASGLAVGKSDLGAVFGAPMVAAGAGQAIAGAGQIAQSAIQSPYTAAMGQLNSGIIGAAGRLMWGDEKWAKLSGNAQKAQWAQKQQELAANSKEFQDAEIASNSKELFALTEKQRNIDTRIGLASSVGKNSLKEGDIWLGGSVGLANDFLYRSRVEADRSEYEKRTPNYVGRKTYYKNDELDRTRLTDQERSSRFTSLAANQGLSTQEYMTREAELQGAFGYSGYGSRSERTRLTGEFSKLSRTGMGSFGDLMGNVNSLQQISGRDARNTESQLKGIMTDAIKAGFDNSRTGQLFIQSAIGVSANLGLSDAKETSRNLGAAAVILGGGIATERSFGLATKGLESLGATTQGVDGLIGSIKMASALNSGLKVGTGLGIAANLNVLQMEEGISQYGALKNARTDEERDKVKQNMSADVRDFLNKQGGDTNKASSMFRSIISAENAPLNARLLQGGGIDLDKKLAELKAANSLANKSGNDTDRRAANQIVADIAAGANEAGKGSAFAPGTLSAYAAGAINKTVGADSSKYSKILEERAVAPDSVRVALQTFIQANARDFSNATGHVINAGTEKADRKRYFEMVSKNPELTIMGAGGKPITKETYEKEGLVGREAMDKTLKDESLYELVRRATEKNESLAAGVQRVRLENASDIGAAVARSMGYEKNSTSKNNLNK